MEHTILVDASTGEVGVTKDNQTLWTAAHLLWRVPGGPENMWCRYVHLCCLYPYNNRVDNMMKDLALHRYIIALSSKSGYGDSDLPFLIMKHIVLFWKFNPHKVTIVLLFSEFSLQHSRIPEIQKCMKYIDNKCQEKALSGDLIHYAVFAIVKIKRINTQVHKRWGLSTCFICFCYFHS